MKRKIKPLSPDTLIGSYALLESLQDGTMVKYDHPHSGRKYVGRIKRLQNGRNIGIEIFLGGDSHWHSISTSMRTKYYIASEADFVLHQMEHA